MSKLLSSTIAAGAVLALSCLGAVPAQALSAMTFVSGKGADAGNCTSPTSPCRTFQYALGQTSAGGEIKALDPADYHPVTIDKSISITGVDGAGIVRTTAGDAITINAGPSDVINLTNLTLHGAQPDPFIAGIGVVLNSSGSVTIKDCIVRNFTHAGILLVPTGAARFLIRDVIASHNGSVGVYVGGPAIGVLDHVSANGSYAGFGIDTTDWPPNVVVLNSVAANNYIGFAVSRLLRLTHSVATGNSIGLLVNSGATAESSGDNFIRGNDTDVDPPGKLTNVGMQ